MDNDFTCFTSREIEEMIINMKRWIADGIKSGQTKDQDRYLESIKAAKAVLIRRNRGEWSV